jgi:hypothetical protein
MSKHLQQLDTCLRTAGREAGKAVRRVPLKANNALVLVLVLVIIPTLSGVALIA